MLHIPLCHKCKDRVTEELPPTKSGIVGHALVGCKCLPKRKWDDVQGNCPIMHAMRIKDERKEPRVAPACV